MMNPDRAFRGRSEPHTPAEPDKQDRILAAARSLFLRYGVRRTSMDDVAREAGIAKGTVYLYFSSKDALFAALAEEMSRDTLAQGVRAMTEAKTDVAAFVSFLDAVIGGPNRLLASSPHAAELLDSKAAFAAPALTRYHADIIGVLHDRLVAAGIEVQGAPEMLAAAAFGALKTGNLAESEYRARLTAMVEVILAGLKPP